MSSQPVIEPGADYSLSAGGEAGAPEGAVGVKGVIPAALLVVAVSAPFLIGIAQVVTADDSSFYTWGDQAFIDMSVREATHLRQLTGPYSRVGWSHPGPLYYYVFAPFYLLLGSALRLYLGALVLNWLTASSIVLLAVKYRGLKTASCLALAVLVLLSSLGPFFIRDPWNPAVILLPLLAAVMAVAVGSTVLTSCIAVVWGSLVVQAHVGSISPVAALVITGTVAGVVTTARWRGHRKLSELSPSVRSVAIVGAVLLICWLPPAIEQIQHGRDGNFGRVARYFLTSGGAQRSIADSADIVAAASWLPSVPFLTPPPQPALPGTLLVAVASLAGIVGAGSAWRRRDRVALVLCGYAAVSFLLTVLSVTRVSGEVYVYLLWWMPINAVVLLAGFLVLLVGDKGALHRRMRGRESQFIGVALTIAVFLVTLGAFNAEPMAEISRNQTAEAWDAVRRQIRGEDAVHLDIRDQSALPHGAGLAVLFDDQGIEYQVDEQYEHLFATAAELDEPSRVTVTLSSSSLGLPEGVEGTEIPGDVPFFIGVSRSS